MANDIRNILTISGNQKLIDEMLKAIQVDAFGRGTLCSALVLILYLTGCGCGSRW